MITIDISIRHDENEKWKPDFTETIEVNRTGKKVLVLAKTVGTSPVTMSLSDLTSAGYCFVKNVGDTGNISFGYNDGSQRSLIRLAPQQFAILPLVPGLTLGAVADQAGCGLQCIVYEG